MSSVKLHAFWGSCKSGNTPLRQESNEILVSCQDFPFHAIMTVIKINQRVWIAFIVIYTLKISHFQCWDDWSAARQGDKFLENQVNWIRQKNSQTLKDQVEARELFYQNLNFLYPLKFLIVSDRIHALNIAQFSYYIWSRRKFSFQTFD